MNRGVWARVSWWWWRTRTDWARQTRHGGWRPLVPQLLALLVVAGMGGGAVAVVDTASSRTTTSGPGQVCPTAMSLTTSQADALVVDVRRLLAELATAPADARAAALRQALTPLGLTPARDTGWRLAAEDLADRLAAAPAQDQATAQLGTLLARAGFSPTPADLRDASTPAVDAGTPTGVRPVVLSRPLTLSAATAPGLLAAAIQRQHTPTADNPTTPGGDASADTALPCSPAADAPSPSAPSATAAVASPLSTSTGAPATSGSGTPPTAASGPDAAAASPTSGDAAPSSAPAAPPGPGVPAGPGGRQGDASGLLAALAGNTDPAAQALAQQLRDSGLLAPAPSSPVTTAARTPAPGAHRTAVPRRSPAATSSSHPPASPMPAPAAETTTPVPPADASSSSTPTPGPVSTAPTSTTTPAGPAAPTPTVTSSADAASGPVSGSPVPGAAPSPSDDWQQTARTLASELAAAGSDPIARSLATALSTALAPPAAGAPAPTPDPAPPASEPGSVEPVPSTTTPPRTPSSPSVPSTPAVASSPSTGGPPSAAADTATWDALAACESGGRWSTSTGNGYSGGLQLDPATWRAFGGAAIAPTAAQASRDQQIAVARRVRDARGGYRSSWPACSARLALR